MDSLTGQATTERTFELDDNRAFAEISGDANPLHLDPDFARRTLFGGIVSHGLHSALWAVDAWCASRSEKIELTGFRADFLNPASPGEIQYCSCEVGSAATSVNLRVHSRYKDTVTVALNFQARAESAPIETVDASPLPVTPVDLALADLTGRCGDTPLHLQSARVANMFPNVNRVLPPWQIAALLATTRIVGMRCPGLHSIYLGLDLSFQSAEIAGTKVEYSVRRTQLATGFTTLEVWGPGVKGTIKAVYRPRPTEQPSYASVKARVAGDSFSAERVLVVGGSRGLGEVAAKVYAAGGADVLATYAKGLKEATRLQEEITQDSGRLRIAQYDVTENSPICETLPEDWHPTIALYFATPHIVMADTEQFVEDLYLAYSRVYVSGYWRLVTELLERSDGLRAVFYPSTVGLEENLPKASEYIAAKAAGEALNRLLSRMNPKLRVCMPRLPRMISDQAVSIMPYDYPDTLEVLVPILLDLASHRE